MERLLIDFIETLDATFRHTLRAHALDAGHEAMTVSQLRLIAAIEQCEPPTPSELARALGITPASVSEQIARLERRGMIERTPSPTDGRSVHVHLVGPAQHLVAARNEAAKSYADLVRTALGREGSGSFAILMQRVLDHVRHEQPADLDAPAAAAEAPSARS